MRNANPKYAITPHKILDIDEFDQLDRLCRKKLGGDDERDSLLILIGINTGGRAIEILNLKRRDFIKSNKSVFIRGVKGSNDREVPIPDYLWRHLEYFFKKHDIKPDQKIFSVSYQRLYQIWLLYRPSPKKFHSLRHTFAIRVYMKTKDIKLVQMALGHRSIINTMVYLDYVYSIEEMKKILF